MKDFPPGITVELLLRGWLVNVDPGLIHPAIALFHHGQLCVARRVKVPKAVASLPMGERVRQVVDLIGAACSEVLGTESPVALVTERPQVYAGAKSKGDPNDLIPLAMIIGGVSTGFRVPTISIVPRDWAGATRKETTGDPWLSPRGQLVESILSTDERARCESSHDAIDSVGMGLKVLNRVRRYYPRG